MFSFSYQIPDKDLEKRRCEQRVDPLTDTLYTKSEYAPEVPTTDEKDRDDEEEEEEEEEEAEEEMIEEEEEVSYDDNDCMVFYSILYITRLLLGGGNRVPVPGYSWVSTCHFQMEQRNLLLNVVFCPPTLLLVPSYFKT